MMYQWTFNGTNIPGATTATLVQTNIQFNQGGVYSVIVSNGFGAVTNSNLNLSVMPLIIKLQPQGFTTNAGTTASFSAAAVGQAPFAYQWLYSGTNLPGATKSSLALTNVQISQSGNYSILVSNAFGAVASSNAYLNVVPLSVVVQPQSQSVGVGLAATFTAAVTGQGPFSYQWRFGGADLAGETRSYLTLPSVQMAQAGTYSVVVSNKFGAVLSSDASLAAVPLYLTVQPKSQTVVRWTPATISVTAGGVPPLQYQWKLNGTNLAGATDSNLLIPSMQADKTGSYSVAVTNEYGTLISSNAFLGITSVAAWGINTSGRLSVPPGATNVVAIAAGYDHCLALRSNGTIVAWGGNDSGQATPPADLTNVVSIVAGARSSSVLKADGTSTGWGLNTSGECDAPPAFTNGVQIAGVSSHRLGLKADGTALGWGYNPYGLAECPPGLSNLVGVAAGGGHSVVLRGNGTVFAWGYDYRTNVPQDLTNVLSIAAGVTHTLALRTDGTVTAWGYNDSGQTNVPLGLTGVIAIAGGLNHSLALRIDGTVVAWGGNSVGQTNIPLGLTMLSPFRRETISISLWSGMALQLCGHRW